MLMVLACEIHADDIATVLDSADIEDWTVLKSSQARRLGQLAIDPPRSFTEGRIIVAAGTADHVSRAVALVTQAMSADEVCTNCRIYTWDVQAVDAGAVAIDPVCGMAVDRSKALHSAYGGREYWFCSDSCKQAFDREPKAYRQGTGT